MVVYQGSKDLIDDIYHVGSTDLLELRDIMLVFLLLTLGQKASAVEVEHINFLTNISDVVSDHVEGCFVLNFLLHVDLN